MRKWWTSVLAGCLCIALSFQSSVSAGQIIGNGNNNVPYFDPFDTAVPLDVKVLNKSSRYAVDVIFPEFLITFSEQPVWNVNSKRYEFPTANAVKDTFDLQVVNHSDLAIAFEATATPEGKLPLRFTCTADSDIWRISGLQSGDKEKIRRVTLTAQPTDGKQWTDVVPLVKPSATSHVGNLTLTVSPA